VASASLRPLQFPAKGKLTVSLRLAAGQRVAVLRRWILEHVLSDLYRRSRYGHNGAICISRFPGEETDVSAASHNTAPSYQTTRTGRPQELHVQVRRRSKVTRFKSGDQRRSQRVVEHGGQEAALNDSRRVQERLGMRCWRHRPQADCLAHLVSA
jgi:hypothetical protein